MPPTADPRTQMQTDYDIVVVGAGLVGLAFACSMRQSGLRILVLDSGDAPHRDSGSYDLRVNSIHIASQTFLDAIGAWQPVQSIRVNPFEAIEVWDLYGSRARFDAAHINEPCLGHIVESNVLTEALFNQAGRSDQVEFRFRRRVTAIEEYPTHAVLSLDSDDSLTARLVIGCDGANSAVRRCCGIQWTEQAYRQKAFVCQVRAAQPSSGVSYQKFLPTGPLALLPLDDGSYSIVWSCALDLADHLAVCDETLFARQLAQSLDCRFGDFRVLSPIRTFDLRCLAVQQYFAGRTVLIGDAAHVVHPLAGMGVNLGLMDAAALSQTLTESLHSGGSLHNFADLRVFDRWRKSENAVIAGVIDRFDRSFSTPRRDVRSVLSLGLSMTNHISVVKQAIMRRACGITGDLPRSALRVQRGEVAEAVLDASKIRHG